MSGYGVKRLPNPRITGNPHAGADNAEAGLFRNRGGVALSAR
jgi:hypothetical protein